MYLIAKSVSKWYPEIFLIVSVLIYWLLTATLVNPIAITLLVLLVAQLRFKNKTFGTILGVSFLLICLYMCLALISEILQVTTLVSGLKLGLFGVLFFGFTAYFSLQLVLKNKTSVGSRMPIGND